MALRVQYLVVHTAAFEGRNCDRAMIDRWHRERGWSGIGYHYVILNDRHDRHPDGTLQEGRPTTTAGAHAMGLNSRSLGICCVGHGDRAPFTAAQRATLLALLSDLMDRHEVPADRVIGHREVNRLVQEGHLGREHSTTKSCPGRMVDMDELRRDVVAFRRPPLVVEPTGSPAEPAALARALGVLARASTAVFPNAHPELRAFLTHPEVITLREANGEPGLVQPVPPTR
jgi:N-acetylmuramoyl-L-alanine amidase